MRCLAALLATALFGFQAPNPAFAPVTDDPRLPRVLLIGDSISIGYTIPVRKLLAGEANVHRIPENAAFTGFGLQHLDTWLGDGRWNVIHFNFGLHDVKRMDDGKPQVALEAYEANLKQIVHGLKKTGATLVFATTTPVPEGKVNPPRIPADVPLYNSAALRVMKAEGVAVDDLYTFALPRLKDIQQPVNVHYTHTGYEALATEVARSIRAALP